MSETIKTGDSLPDISVNPIVKDEIKDIKLSLLFFKWYDLDNYL